MVTIALRAPGCGQPSRHRWHAFHPSWVGLRTKCLNTVVDEKLDGKRWPLYQTVLILSTLITGVPQVYPNYRGPLTVTCKLDSSWWNSCTSSRACISWVILRPAEVESSYDRDDIWEDISVNHAWRCSVGVIEGWFFKDLWDYHIPGQINVWCIHWRAERPT